MNASGPRKLFSSVQLGPSTLQHRVVMASLARSRSVQPGDVPGDLIKSFSTMAENS
jgi:N-ethylmaleimide reductase